MNADNNLLFANNKLTEANEKFAKVNKELVAVNKELFLINNQMKQHNIKQKEFIAISCHELRTPLQIILGYVEMLLVKPSNIEYVKFIKRNAERLQNILANLIDISKIDNNLLILYKEKFNLGEVISDTVQDFRNQIVFDKKNVSIVYDDIYIEKKDEIRLVVDGDKQRIIQVISNIIDNAIKATKEGTIHINLEPNYNANINKCNVDNISKEILVKITDSGIGINPQLFPQLFSKFFSSAKTDRSGTTGTGLGLYISKAIIEAHGGKIWAENNKDGKGSTFLFSLPLIDSKTIVQ